MEEYEIDLRDYLRVIWEKKFLIVGIFLVSVIAAGAFSALQEPHYVTSTTLLITPTITEELEKEQQGEFPLSTETYRQMAMANDILREIIDKNQLKNARGEPISVGSLRGRMTASVQMKEDGQSGSLPLLSMTVTGTDPQEIKAIAGTWNTLFKEKYTSLLSSRTARSYEFISERFEEIEGELTGLERKRQEYLEEHPLESLKTEKEVLKSTYNTQLNLLQQKRRQLHEKKSRLAALEREVESGGGSSQISDDVLTQIALENEVYLNLEDYLTDLRVSVETLNKEVSYLENSTAQLKEDINTKEKRINAIQMELKDMDRKISTLETSYSTLSKKRLDARMAKSEQLQSIRVLEEPVAPEAPVGTSKMLNIAIAGVLGLFVGVFAAFFKHYIESEEE